jgi:hypothetical protein
MDAVVEWVDVRERLPEMIGYPVAAAVSGRYRAEPGETSGQDFWLVLPMYFTDRHLTENGTEYHDCFVDFDGVIRLPYGRPSAESVTHWAYLPTLPGTTVHSTLGEDAQTALRNALS